MTWSFKAEVDAAQTPGTTLINTANVDTDTPDDDPTNNDFEVDVTIPFPDLQIIKNGDTTVLPGETMIHTISYQNLNRQTAVDTYIIDKLPDVVYTT